jgi:hypothetical protein
MLHYTIGVAKFHANMTLDDDVHFHKIASNDKFDVSHNGK